MWIEHFFLGFAGLASGIAVSAGTFAFIIVIGVVPRMIGKCNRAAGTILFENMIVAGGILGNIVSVYLDIELLPDLLLPWLGSIIVSIYGLCTGIFVGCIAVALAEILNTFPIMFRRFRIKEGLSWVMLFMALGKTCGAFYYFWTGMRQ